jgi:hypothetical protein
MEEKKMSSQEEVKEAIDKLFASLKLSYQYFMHKKSDIEINDTKRMWFYHLQGFTAEQIAKGAEEMITVHPDQAPELGEFKKMIRVVRPELEYAPKKLAAPAWDERTRAKTATIVTYNRRQLDQKGTANIVYDGGFDYQAVAKRIPITGDAKRNFKSLVNLFNQEWIKFKQENKL